MRNDLPRDNEYTYTLTERFGGWHHSYVVETRWGAVELRITTYPESMGIDESSAGLEFHYRQPPDYMANRPPSHSRCRALRDTPCWHDGTSSWALEHYLPLWTQRRTEHEMFQHLLADAARMAPEKEEAPDA